MSSEKSEELEAHVDQDPPRAPGGADAAVSESDVGAASEGTPVTPDPPLSAQKDEADLPDEIQTREPPDEETDDDTVSEPSA